MTYYNLARMYTGTTGDSDITLSTAVNGCKTFAEAGVSDSEDVYYGLITYSLSTRLPVGSETGLGRYISSGTVFKRTNVESSTDSDNSAIDLTGLTEIYITPPASRFNVGFGVPVAAYSCDSANTIADASDFELVNINTEDYDNDSIATISSNTVTIAEAGWYFVGLKATLTPDSTFNGWARLYINEGLYIEGWPVYYPTAAGMNTAFTYFIPPQLVNLTAGSQIKIYCDNHSGDNLTVSIDQLLIAKVDY